MCLFRMMLVGYLREISLRSPTEAVGDDVVFKVVGMTLYLNIQG